MRSHVLAAITIALTGVLLASGCAPREKSRVSIGLSPWPGYELVHVAQDQGYFDDEGLHVHLVEQASTGDTRRSYERGQLDVWCGSNAEVIFARAGGARAPRVVMVFDASNGADILLADRSIRSIAELRGKRVALEPASLDVVATHHALTSAGLRLSDLRVVGMSQGDVPRALAEGRVVAAETYPPTSIALLADSTRWHRLFDSSRAPGAILDVLVMDSTFLEHHAHRAAAIMRALGRAETYFASHREQVLASMAERERITRGDVDRSLGGIRPYAIAEQESLLRPEGTVVRSLREALEALRESGAIDSVPPVDGLADPAVVRAATERRR